MGGMITATLLAVFFVPVFFVVVRRFFKAPPVKPADDTPALSNTREGQA
jgi:multidrug efflux pump